TLYETAPDPLGRSRFLMPVSVEGWPLPSAADGVTHAYDRLLADRRAAAAPAAPPEKVVKLKYAGKTANGYVLLPRGEVAAGPLFESVKPTRFAKLKGKQAGELLDEFFLGLDPAWTSALDSQLWDALLAFIEEEEPAPSVIRSLNDRLAIALCLRAGLDI